MSWLSGYKKSNPSSSLAEEREKKRKNLETERLLRAQQRASRQKQLQEALKSQQEADKALQEFLEIDPELFAGEEVENSLTDAEVELLLSDNNETMANFDELNTDNGADAIKSLGQIKVNWDAEDPQYFFQKLETELQIFEINKQYTKRQALIRALPDEVAKEFKHLVNLQETQAGALAYKDLKKAIIKSYGPRPGDAFQRAMSRVMVAKPSSLLKLLIADICPTNLQGCTHCPSTIWGLFMLQVPMYLKNGLANEEFSETTMQGIMDRADGFYAANQTDKNVSAVATTVAAVSTSDTQSASEVAAVGAPGRGRGNFRARGRGGRNRGRGGQGRGNQSQQPDPRGKRHESNPPWNACTAHWLYYDKAWKCQAPTTCPMKDKVTPKQ